MAKKTRAQKVRRLRKKFDVKNHIINGSAFGLKSRGKVVVLATSGVLIDDKCQQSK